LKALLLAFCYLFTGVAHAHVGHMHGEPTSQLRFAQGRVVARVSWITGPQVAVESLMRIEWRDENAALIDPVRFDVVLWMPSMDHGSAPTRIERFGDGVYQVSNVYFIMGGEWDVHVTLTYPDGTQETQTISVDLPDHGHHHHH